MYVVIVIITIILASILNVKNLHKNSEMVKESEIAKEEALYIYLCLVDPCNSLMETFEPLRDKRTYFWLITWKLPQLVKK